MFAVLGFRVYIGPWFRVKGLGRDLTHTHSAEDDGLNSETCRNLGSRALGLAVLDKGLVCLGF